jgi:uncharacterized protein (DUF1697 family)
MIKYIALLRGINVGGKNKVEMIKLKSVFENAGFHNVLTYINSGNVIFESNEKDVETLILVIKKVLRENFNFDIKVLIRNSSNIGKLAKKIPSDWQNDGVQKTDVLFLWDDFDNKKSLSLIKQVVGVDNVLYINGAIVWNIYVKDWGKSGMSKFTLSELYKNMTARNVNTVRKLAVLMN